MSAPRDLSDLLGAIQPITADQTDAVRRHIAAHAHDTDDARLLTDALGIGPT